MDLGAFVVDDEFLLLDRHLELDHLRAGLGGLLMGVDEGRRDELDLLARERCPSVTPRAGTAATRVAMAAAAIMVRRVNIVLSKVFMSLFHGDLAPFVVRLLCGATNS